jgi:hypothetical protein
LYLTRDLSSELKEIKSQYLSDDAVSGATVPQRRTSFFTVPWHIKLEIYRKLNATDLINFHLAFPQSTFELAPFYYLKSNLNTRMMICNDLWPVITVKRTPNPIEEELIHAAYNLNLRLKVPSVETFNGISAELRRKVTELVICGESISGGFFFNLTIGLMKYYFK